MDYTYENVVSSPDTDQIHSDVGLSTMIDKGIVGCRWDEDVSKLRVTFTSSLSGEDKIKLDTIVSSNS